MSSWGDRATIKELEQENAQLKERIKQLEKRIKRLEGALYCDC
jgi:cell division protein FtsB